jgi:acetolactate synthase-1/2/3 large subunit
VPESFARAYGVMMTQPQGPVYMIYDAWLQEQKLDHPIALPPPHAVKVPARIGPDPAALVKAADMIAAAEHPVVIAEYTGRDHEAFDALVKLGERTLLSRRHPSLRTPVGQPIFVRLDPDKCIALKAA